MFDLTEEAAKRRKMSPFQMQECAARTTHVFAAREKGGRRARINLPRERGNATAMTGKGDGS